VFNEMMQIIGKVEGKTIAQLILPVICVILQIDDKMDGQMTQFGEMQCAFFGMFQLEKFGVVVLESAIKSCQSTGMLVGITIGGEDGNTGRTGGLWKLLEDRVYLVLVSRYVVLNA
jgi:hypothetical protein